MERAFIAGIKPPKERAGSAWGWVFRESNLLVHETDTGTTLPRTEAVTALGGGDELVLARNSNFPGAFYSILAGFVEAGESLEETVRREIREEVSIEVKDVTYFGSQSWPFPNSLMIGFTAQYASGEICVD